MTTLKHRFGIDIDGTVTCPATLLPHINKQYNINMTLADVTEYDFLSGFPYPVNRDEFQAWFKENEPFMYEVSELAENARQILQQWQPKYELYYISARGTNVLEITQNWFHAFDVPYDHIELIGKHDKIAMAKKYQVEAFFEDKHDNAVEIAEQLNIPVILFNTPYNQQTVPTNVIRVNNWLEANNWISRNF
ncbi:hypothetical protein CSE16_14390 [Solibacillus sp. R5-41]|uniref:hypothetical protein n=1 Tax=Solibacillus sp. R5-41 TaxID=2048654 RepID=UPI000C127D6B|nr:hypothetical protein [Solibacillus sp. R5-41]ATP41145.1 hypothetical protein CSE16_14390 [Solibacillus sp. R5-41]